MSHHGSLRTDGYLDLAGAVVRQTLGDLEHGPPQRRAEARYAIRSGALDFWVGVLARNGRAYETACARLRKLAC